MISHIVEDYLKTIYYLQEESDMVSTSALAERLGVTAPTVTNMLQKLAQQRHRGATLTPAGRKIALEIIRHHRLIELYLAEELHYSWDQVHDEAEKLEHVISEEFEDRIAERLGDPRVDPHGNPIPTKSGALAKPTGITLAQLEIGHAAHVTRVGTEDPDFLRYLTDLGIGLQTRLVVVDRAPFDGMLHVIVNERSQALSQAIADKIYVDVE